MLDISNDLNNVQNKLGTIIGSISQILDKVEVLESRIVALEEFRAKSERSISTYSETLTSNISNPQSPLSRIDKLEFITSEDEKKSRLLQATITHPNIDLSNQDLTMHVKQFL